MADDHADESTCVAGMAPLNSRRKPRSISPDELKLHSGADGSFWAVVDGFVVDASEFVDTHPGGLRKLLSTNSPAAGASGSSFGFSFSRGRNAHFPDTGKRFQRGVQKYLAGAVESVDVHLPPVDVPFQQFGKLIILGRLEE